MKLAYAAVAAALLAASPVKAQVVDLSTITCAKSPDFPVAGALGKAPGWHDMTGRPGDCPRSTP